MKGDISPIVYVVVAIIVGMILLVMLFVLGIGPFSSEGSAAHCKNQILKACGRYETTGKTREFNTIPSTCGDILKGQLDSTGLEKCKNGDASACRDLCEWIKTGG